MKTNNKLREAIETLVDVVDAWKDHLPPVIREGELEKAIEKAESALAEPPRNCERFRNADEALEALERHCNSSGNGCIRCPVAGSSTNEVECKIAWLFALATEKEGGAK